MLIFKVKIKQKLNSEPEITRKNEIFPGTENFGSRGKSYEVSRMNFFNGKVGMRDPIGIFGFCRHENQMQKNQKNCFLPMLEIELKRHN